MEVRTLQSVPAKEDSNRNVGVPTQEGSTYKQWMARGASGFHGFPSKGHLVPHLLVPEMVKGFSRFEFEITTSRQHGSDICRW